MRIFSRITSLASLAAVGLLIAGPANSADIARPVYKAAPPPIATFSWSGLYVGGHAGAAWTDFDSRWDPLPSAAAFTAQTQSHGVSDTAFVGGALIGYNWQFQQWVLGVEGDFGTPLGLDKDWAYRVIKHLGNYGEMFDRNVGKNSPIGLERGLNALWKDGGIQYSPPIR